MNRSSSSASSASSTSSASSASSAFSAPFTYLSHMSRTINVILVFMMFTAGFDSVMGQSFSISTDTVLYSDCEQLNGPLDAVWIYSNQDQDINLNWEVIDFSAPPGSNFAVVILGIEFPPSISQGDVYLKGHVTDSVMFYFFHDQWEPGDSAIMHFKLYVASDSINTQQFITAIHYCPLSTSFESVDLNKEIRVYPNPAEEKINIYLDESVHATSAELYSMNGKRVQELPLTTNFITVSRQQLPAGLYLVRVMRNNECVASRKITFY